MKTIIRFVLLGVIIYFIAENFSGITVSSIQSAIIAAVVLSLVNLFVRPLLKLVSLPISILTFGLFCFVINALMVMLMDYVVGGFSVASFWWALLFSVLISFASSLLDKFVD